jgi:hypothetical protein
VHLNTKNTIKSVANATELATSIIHKLMGNEISNSINGSIINRTALADIVSLRIQSRFSKFTKNYGA